jgi:hypothetical protein
MFQPSLLTSREFDQISRETILGNRLALAFHLNQIRARSPRAAREALARIIWIGYPAR